MASLPPGIETVLTQLHAELFRQQCRIEALENTILLLARATIENNPECLRGHAMAVWLLAWKRKTLENNLRQCEDMNPAMAAWLQEALDRIPRTDIQPDDDS